MSDAVLRLENVTVQFGGLTACNDVAFDVRPGELYGLIGPNGAGKTTVLNAITGVYAPSAGARITYVDRAGVEHALVGRRPHDITRLGITRTFQNLGLFPAMSVLDNLMLGRFVHQRTGLLAGGLALPSVRRDEREQRARVEEVIDLLGLGDVRDTAVEDLPYGEQKRVELARAVAMEPHLLLLDEPMAGMTFDEKKDILRVILEVHRRLDLTVLMVEHDMAVVMSLVDRVTVLDFGTVLATADPETVQRNPTVIDAYLGSDDSPSPSPQGAQT